MIINNETNSATVGVETESAPKAIGTKEIQKAAEILEEYSSGKQSIDKRIVENEEYWKMRQWDKGIGDAVLSGENKDYRVYSTPWLHTCIESRIADAMDNYPTCVFHARQRDDVNEAKKLSSIVPVILDINDYEGTYHDVSRYALMQGTGYTGIFWDGTAHNGIGEILIKKVDALSLAWEPGVNNIQDSRNVFHTSVLDNDLIEQRYPQAKGKLNTTASEKTKYRYDDSVKTEGKSKVIDWYYKRAVNGKIVLHFCKFVNDIVLFASENDPKYADGYYHHGRYPFVPRTVYAVEGSPSGYGITDLGKSTQLQIDLLNKAIVDNATEAARPRYWNKNGSSVNRSQFNDPTNRIVGVEGSIDEEHLRPIETPPLPGNCINVLSAKIDELKFCTANQDVNSGVAPTGVTAGSALSALIETGGKPIRLCNRSFHRAFKEEIEIVVELIRQFYDVPRVFRIMNDVGQEQFMEYANAGLQPIPQYNSEGKHIGDRVPEFDISISTEKANPYTRMEHNELAIQMYNLGVFNPQNTDQALCLLQHMDFDGKEDMIETVSKNASMMHKLLQYQQLCLELLKEVDPAKADLLAQSILSSGQGSNPQVISSGEVNLSVDGAEHPFSSRSRSAARNSTAVD